MSNQQYETQALLHQGIHSEIQLGYRLKDQTKVTIKSMHPDTPDAAHQLEKELQHLRKLHHPNIIQAFEITRINGRPALIKEYFSGHPLKQKLNGSPFSLEAFFDLCIPLTETVMYVHTQGLIHANLNPSNVLIHQDDKRIKLTGFGHSFPPSDRDSANEQHLADPAYQAPEQSGRMNSQLNYQTDIYSLGILFYEMLSGQLPFQASDRIELMHSHIAKTAQPLAETEHNIPEVLSKIIDKMMAKNPKSRYQTLTALVADLHICQNALRSKQELVDFEINRHESPSQLNRSGRLYGRDTQIKQLLDSYERTPETTDHAHFTLIKGPSGVGKSCLVIAAQKRLQNPGLQLSVKFEQFNRSTAIDLLHQALKELVLHLLSQDTDQVLQWKRQILSQLGNHTQVVIDVVPELEIMLGPQPALEELPALDAKARTNQYINRFLSIFCQETKSLTLVLDDLQWADAATFDWLESCLHDVNHLHVIGTYRDNEVVPGHPLHQLLLKLESQHFPIHSIALNALSESAVTTMIQDKLHLDDKDAQDIASAVIDKTEGNPFFVIQYLKQLQDDHILWYDTQSSSWKYNIDRILQSQVSNDVMGFLTSRLSALPESIQQVLKLAACIGHHFSYHELRIIAEPVLDIQQALESALESGWILSQEDDKNLDKQYVFSHDRVQQAAWSLFSEHELQLTHLAIGRHMQQHDNLRDKETLLKTVEHLNRAEPLIRNREEKYQLAELNFQAGILAKRAGDFNQALGNLVLSMRLFDAIQRQPSEEVTLLKERAECEHLCGNDEQAKTFYELAVSKAKSNMDKALLYELMINFHTDNSEFEQAYQISRKALRLFDQHLPAKFNTALFLKDYLLLTSKIRGRQPKELLDLPINHNNQIDIVVRLLSATLKAAYQIKPQLCVAVSVKLLRICLEHGNTREAVVGYMVFGVIFLGAVRGQHQLGHEYGQLALAMLDKFNNIRQRAEVKFVVGYFAHSWMHSAKETENLWHRAFTVGQEIGDWFHTSSAAAGITQSMFMRGVPLREVLDEAERFIPTLQRIGGQEQLITLQGIRHLIKALQSQSSMPGKLEADFDERAFIESLQKFGSRHFAHYYFVNKMACLYFQGHYHQAYDSLKESEQYLSESQGMLHSAEHTFYSAMILAKLANSAPWWQALHWQNVIQKISQTYQQWAKDNCENFLVRYHLILGELHRLRGQVSAALEHYEIANQKAEKYQQHHLQGVANLLAAVIYDEIGQPRSANLYRKQAKSSWQFWGMSDPNAVDTLSPQMPKTQKLDMETLLKSSQLLSRERRLPDLLRTLIHLVIENAGAQRGVLLLKEPQGLFIQAESTLEDETNVMQGLALNAHTSLPQSVINYVFHTDAAITVDNAMRSPIFAEDKDITHRHVLSILCAPLKLHGETKGILYLENNITEQAFSPENVELLTHLSGQMAVFIDHAKVYETLEAKVCERTENIEQQRRELEAKNDELEAQNNTIIELNNLLKTENEERLKVKDALQKANNELYRMANTDDLTQLHNRRSFDQHLIKHCFQQRKSTHSLALFLCDVDFFKAYNDHYGHQQGDACLQRVAQELLTVLPSKDALLARYGGEEFALVYHNCSASLATELSNQIHEAILALQLRHEGTRQKGYLSVSLGLAIAPPNASIQPQQLIEFADQALYKAKEGGRNHTVIKKITATDLTNTTESEQTLPIEMSTDVMYSLDKET